MSPTATIDPLYRTADVHDADWPWGGVYPGCGDDGWAGRGIPGTHPGTSQDPIFNHIQPQGLTYGQMKAILRFI